MFYLGLLLVSAAAAIVLLSHRFPWWRRPAAARLPRVLCYHMVADPENAGPIANLAVSPLQFEQQVKRLSSQGWHFATVSELFAADLPEKTVAITFDDGYADNLTLAMPILERYGARATVYVIADRSEPLADGGFDDGRPFAPLLTDGQLRDLQSSGIVEIGAHSVSHRRLQNTDLSVVRFEVEESKRTLEAILEQPVQGFAYPFSAVNETACKLVEAAGFKYAVTGGGISTDLRKDRFQLKRIRISGSDSIFNFMIKLRIGRKR